MSVGGLKWFLTYQLDRFFRTPSPDGRLCSIAMQQLIQMDQIRWWQSFSHYGIQEPVKWNQSQHGATQPNRDTLTWGMIHPCSNAWSMIEHSMFFIVTGGSEIPSTHDPSQGAGHTRPVNSGKLFVCISWLSASFHSSWKIKSFHLGIMFPKGQPVRHRSGFVKIG